MSPPRRTGFRRQLAEFAPKSAVPYRLWPAKKARHPSDATTSRNQGQGKALARTLVAVGQRGTLRPERRGVRERALNAGGLRAGAAKRRPLARRHSIDGLGDTVPTDVAAGRP